MKLKRMLCFCLMFVLMLSQISFASQKTQQDDYLLKAQIVKEQVTPEAIYKNQNVATVNSASSQMVLGNVSLSDFYIAKKSTIEKYGVKFEEITYKKKKTDNILSVLRSSGPENGDFKIIISKGSFAGEDWTNGNTSSYGLYILSSGYFKMINTISGLTISNPVKGLLVGETISLLQQDLKGSGNVFTKKRTVSKWGQIYKNGSWIDYYYGTQVELKWGYDYYVYNKKSNGSGDTNAVFQLANGQYRSNQYIYRDYSGPTDYVYSQDWRNGINPAY